MQSIYYQSQGRAQDVLVLAELPTPTPRAGEVRVRIKASGVNPSDVKTRAGLRGAMAYPRIIPHSDGAGLIDAVGEGVSSSREGQNVWLYNAAFGRAHGTAAEYVCVPESLAVPLPAAYEDFTAAATFGIPAQTAMHALLKGGDVRGKYVLVTGGAGSVGYYAVQFAKRAGARVITTVSNDEKRAHAQTAEPFAIVNYKSEDCAAEIMELTKGHGVDHIIEVEFGGNLPITAQIVAAHASIATYGSEREKTPSVPFYPLMFKNVSLHWVFVYLLNEDERAATLMALRSAIEAGIRSPIAARFSPNQAAQSHQAVEAGKKIGNIVIEFP